MFMLSLIALLLLGAAVYRFVLWFNGYTRDHANYMFFTTEHTMVMVASYALIYLGYRWINTGSDWLNGAIVMAIGVIILLAVMVNNFLSTPRVCAIAGSLAQLILYVPITIGAVIIVILFVAWASQTKPVYTINGRD